MMNKGLRRRLRGACPLIHDILNKPWLRIVGIIVALTMTGAAMAAEYRSVAAPKAVLYDAPSANAKKTFVLSQYYPVEIVINLGEWLKVRDVQGGLNWVEAKQLSGKRTIIVIGNNAEIRQAADPASPQLATLEKDVALELADAKPINGWIKVKHRDGLTGFVLMTSVWGI